MFRPEQTIGDYTLIEKLGRGGFGEVWLAEYNEELFALKLPHKDQVDWKSITQEIGLWTLCGKHPNIMPIVGARNFNGQIAIISEYAPDGSLEDLLRKKGNLSEMEAVEMTIGILEGLQHLHESGIIHRDLKPANILLDGDIPRLTDFGISRIISADSSSETIAGTWAYMAPECFDGKRNVQTDIWAVGVILYRMLTGNFPFPQKEQTSLIGAIIMYEPEIISVQLDKEFERILLTALEKTPLKRYKTANELSDELDNNFKYLKSKPHFIKALTTFGHNEQDTKSRMEILIKSLSEEYNFPHEVIHKIKPHISRFINEIQIGSIKIETPKGSFKPQNKELPKLIPYRKGKKWGYCNSNKEIIIDLKYYDAWKFNNEIAMVEMYEGHSFINSTGQIISNGQSISNKYDNSWSFHDDIARVLVKGLYSFIDKSGKEILNQRYYDAHDFSENIAAVKNNEKWGFIDKNGNEIIPFIYENAKSFNEGLAAIKLDNKWGFIDTNGIQITACIFDDTWAFKEDPKSFNEGLARVCLNNKWGFINRFGEVIVPFQFDDVLSFSDGLAAVKLDYKYGFINSEDKFIIPAKYAGAKSFSEGLAAVKVKDNKWGFINYFDEEIISFKYDDVLENFENGLARVQVNSEFVPSNYSNMSLRGQLADCDFGYIKYDGTEYFED